MPHPTPSPSVVLVIGGGGREHALAWALARSAGVARVYAAPGNGGTAREPKVENVAIGETDGEALAAFARERGVSLAVVGPEKPLALGIADRLRAAGIPTFGPSLAAARIETSKAWARDFMRRHGVPQPAFTVGEDLATATRAIHDLGGRCVIKADGLAAGKGVVVCDRVDEAVAAARDMIEGGMFGAAGARVLVEERAEGPELSVMAISDGGAYALLLPAQDHKRLQDGDRGPNTGGMGAYAPAPIGTPALLAELRAAVFDPVLGGMRSEGHPFTGCLYCGLMLTVRGPVVIEFNARFGDPETQVQLPLVASDLAELLGAAAHGGLDPTAVRFDTDRSAACVVLASGGYPARSEKDVPIYGLAAAESMAGIKVFHAGTRIDPATGEAVTTGGRALGVVCVRGTLAAAVDGAYGAIAEGGAEDDDRVSAHGPMAVDGSAAPPGIRFSHMQYRRDIAHRALAPES